MRRTATVIGLLAGWLAVSPVQAQSPRTQDVFVLDGGDAIAGHIVHATRNTLTIRRDIGGIEQVPRDRLVLVDVTLADGARIRGEFAGWREGRTGIETGGQRLWLEEGRIVEREPLAGARPSVARPAQRQPSKVDASAIEAPTAPSKGARAEAAAIPASRKASARHDARKAAMLAAARQAATGRSSPKPEGGERAELPTLTVVPSAVELGEDAREVTFALELSRPSEEAIRVVYATVDGEAVKGEDYLPQEGVLTISPGTKRHELRVQLIDDDHREADKSFHLFISTRPELATVSTRWTSIVIRDDD